VPQQPVTLGDEILLDVGGPLADPGDAEAVLAPALADLHQ